MHHHRLRPYVHCTVRLGMRRRLRQQDIVPPRVITCAIRITLEHAANCVWGHVASNRASQSATTTSEYTSCWRHASVERASMISSWEHASERTSSNHASTTPLWAHTLADASSRSIRCGLMQLTSDFGVTEERHIGDGPACVGWRRRPGDGIDISGSENAPTGGASNLVAATSGYPDARTYVVRVCIGEVGDGIVGQCASISVVEACVRDVEGGPACRHVRRQSMRRNMYWSLRRSGMFWWRQRSERPSTSRTLR